MASAGVRVFVLLAVGACSGAIDDQGFVVRSARRSIGEVGNAGSAGLGAAAPIAGAAGMAAAGQGGAREDAAVSEPAEPPAPSIFDAEPTCTSGEYWDDGDDGDRRMHPGRACVACHSEREGPRFAIAGTVFPTAHEPDECEGLDGEDEIEARVVITDATGREFQLEVNEVGNFHSQPGDDIVMPIRAKVVQGDRERVMFGERMSGDCNACHTQRGDNGAPGRIVAP